MAAPAVTSLRLAPAESEHGPQPHPLESCQAKEARPRESRQIVCFGGMPSPSADNPLHNYLLATTRKPRPRICLLLSRPGDNRNLVDAFYRAFQEPRCEPSHILAGDRSRGRDAKSHLVRQDVILVGEGSLIHVLGLWRFQGIDTLLHESWRRGTVLCGFRAGALCWFAEAVTAFDGELRASRGLGLLPWSGCTHYHHERARRAAYRSHLLRGMQPGYAVEEGAALHFVGTRLHSALSAVSGRRAFRVRAEQGEIIEEPLPMADLCNGNPHDSSRVRGCLASDGGGGLSPAGE